MFVLFINDMPEVVAGCIEMFANDAKIFKAMSTEQDRSDLQGVYMFVDDTKIFNIQRIKKFFRMT